jgi:hypothetical protein
MKEAAKAERARAAAEKKAEKNRKTAQAKANRAAEKARKELEKLQKTLEREREKQEKVKRREQNALEREMHKRQRQVERQRARQLEEEAKSRQKQEDVRRRLAERNQKRKEREEQREQEKQARAQQQQENQAHMQKWFSEMWPRQRENANRHFEATNRTEWDANRSIINKAAYSKAPRQTGKIDAASPQFQSWMKSLFANSTHSQKPTLLRAMRIPKDKSILNSLDNVLQESGTGEGKKKMLKDACTEPTPTTGSIQAHQAVVYAMAQMRASDKLKTAGILVMHSTGAGKTIIGLSVLIAFWNKKTRDNKPFPVLMVSTNDNQTDNDTRKLAKLAMILFPNFVDETTRDRPFARPNNKGLDYFEDDDVITLAQKRIDERLNKGILAASQRTPTETERTRRLYTYATLGNDLRQNFLKFSTKKYSPAVFIVDEIQYLIDPPESEKGLKPQYDLVWNMLARERNPATTWCVGMTATPGEEKAEIVKIMNAVQGNVPPGAGPGPHMSESDSLEALKRKARGYVSYAYLLGDRSRYAQVSLTMMCSYLEGSYYHDPYVRRVYRMFHNHPAFKDQGKEFISKIVNDREWQLKAKKGPDELNANDPSWFYNPERKDKYMRQLKMLSMFVPINKEEMEYLEQKLNPKYKAEENEENNNDDNPNVRRKKRLAKILGNKDWYLQELFMDRVAVSTTPPQNAANDNVDEGAEADEHAFSRNNQYEQRIGQANKKPHRQSRHTAVYRYYRYLLSPKIPQLVKKIYSDLAATREASKGIHYVYTSTSTSALLVAHALNKVLRMPQLKDASLVRPGAGPYFVTIDNLVSNVPMLAAYQTKPRQIKALKDLVSRDENARGNIVKVVIASKKSFKGVDLRHIRFLHLLDPFVNFRDFIQFVGRGPRNCSHKALPVQQRKVDVLLYRLAYSPQEQCNNAKAALADCFLWNKSFERYTGPGGFKNLEDKVLWEPSVDYELFKDNLSKARNSLTDMIKRMNMCYDPKRRSDAGDKAGFLGLGQNVQRHRRMQIQKNLKGRHPKHATMPLRLKKYRSALVVDPASANQKYQREADWLAYMKNAKPLKRQLIKARKNMQVAAPQANFNAANNKMKAKMNRLEALQSQYNTLKMRYPQAAARNAYLENTSARIKKLDKYVNVVAEDIRA